MTKPADVPTPKDPTRADQLSVAVIGAGAMGAGIAQVAAEAGHPVTLVDSQPGAADTALERLVATYDTLVAKGRRTREEADATLARISTLTTADMRTLPPVGLVIEAVVEQIDIKRAIFRQLEEAQSPTTVLATNTSSLSIDAITGEATTGHDAALHGGRSPALTHPGRVLGLHFFNPPALMKLVEVIAGSDSDPAILDDACTLMQSWGKTPVRCTSTPGFIVNRVARPFYGEAQRMVAEGLADAATIDLALRNAGFRMGPMELTDLIGQDVNYAVGESVWRQTGQDPRYAPTDYQHDLVRSGRLGRKSGQGVFRYDESGTALDAHPDEVLATRLVGGPLRTDPVARTVAMLVNEGVDLVARGEATAADVDTAMRLGTNYPKGPFEWLAEIGADTIRAQLAELDAAYPGGRYRPSPALDTDDGSTEADLTHVTTMWEQDQASAALGIEALEVGVDGASGLGFARTRMRVVESMVNGHDILHGGYLFIFADSTFALACNASGRLTVAAAADISFLTAGHLGDVLIAEARERVTYGRSGITDVTVMREDGEIVAEFRGRSRSLPPR
ncbi:MAG: 3-hydroxyacyl-CoA dehydrogenase NAD-binding domain-containing protein [Ornithinimicrobium sp.]|uniref:3-hydroxyacyl-CoA dehydrogenase NAD-binding domain-containing protein n=1 Tax=Ornithinimicrobium sp. TaxID=1977084 RepID=UPI0026E0D25F|nr:3-hydroxyacyl-CoA dehydrogenase NAD-binding domain-containing protein [Ornithinimicrobium sp.]MDO5739910.1 3-hydroxyacyl-CoA dehydrogenase NAD-binding domain-containing protein [Ornithinimicrobium sp.]